MNWLTFVGAILGAMAALVTWLGERGRLKTEQARALAAHLQDALDEIAHANAARGAVRGDLQRHPDGLHDNDGFERGD